MPGAKQELIIPRRLFSKSLHKKEKGALHKCFPSSSITYRLLQNVGTELTAPARSQPGAQEVTDQLWMTDGSRTPAVMDGVGLGPQKASEELCAVQFCLPQTCPSPPATSQPSPVTHCPALLGGPGGAAWVAVGGATSGGATGPASLLPRPWHSSAQSPGHAVRDSVQGRPRPFSMDHTPWRWLRGTFWIINRESGHGNCPLL